MFLIKIFHFFKGYVILSLRGHNKEEFLNSLFDLGIYPHSIKSHNGVIFTQLSVSDFFALRSSPVRTDMRIEKKCGLVFLLRILRHRKAFLSGLALFILMFAVGSQFVWSVNYEGVENCDIKQLEAATELAGLKAGMLKRNLLPPLEMKNIILNNTDGICWVWVYVKGTRAVVKVRENIIPPQIFSPDTPCDIIAMRNGIIKRVITRHGKCVVTENQAVAAGDTLISGTFEFADGEGYTVHASGDAEAYTQHIKSGTFKLSYRYKRYTGKQRRLLKLRLFGKEIPLYFRDVRFEHYDSETREYAPQIFGGFFSEFGLTRTVCREYITESEPISYDAAAEFAQRQLEKEIARELLPEARLLDKNSDIKKIDEQTISVTLTMDFIEKIGTEKRIEEVTPIEPKTD